MIESSTQAQQIKYNFLEPPYKEEATQIFIPELEQFPVRLTVAEFDKDMFKAAKKDIQTFDKRDMQANYKALVAMRQIASSPEVRNINEVKYYIRFTLIRLCCILFSYSSKKRRYQASLILENLAQDYTFCQFLIQKQVVENLLSALSEKNISIRNKAISALRKTIHQICFHEPPNEHLIKKAFQQMINALRRATQRIQIRQILWIAQNLYKSKSLKILQKSITIFQIFSQVIKQNILKPNETEELQCILKIMSRAIRMEPKDRIFIIGCIKQYQLLYELMEYADKQKRFSQPALVILQQYAIQEQKLFEESFTDKQNFFFRFIRSQIKNIQSRTKLFAILRILKRMTQNKKIVKILLRYLKLLDKFNLLLKEKDEQVSFIIFEIFQNIIQKAPLQNKIIISITSQALNFSKPMMRLIQPDKKGKITYLWPGLRIIQETLNYGRKNDKGKGKGELIINRFQKLGLVQKLLEFENIPDPDPDPNLYAELRRTAKNIRSIYWPELQRASLL